jgi:nucleoid-associated protein YgaU
MYTVQRGDTLMALARKYYGDQKLWKVIRDANSESFKDKPTLDVGQQLWIPPKPEGVSP